MEEGLGAAKGKGTRGRYKDKEEEGALVVYAWLGAAAYLCSCLERVSLVSAEERQEVRCRKEAKRSKLAEDVAKNCPAWPCVVRGKCKEIEM
jgi:hypothetical protein